MGLSDVIRKSLKSLPRFNSSALGEPVQCAGLGCADCGQWQCFPDMCEPMTLCIQCDLMKSHVALGCYQQDRGCCQPKPTVGQQPWHHPLQLGLALWGSPDSTGGHSRTLSSHSSEVHSAGPVRWYLCPTGLLAHVPLCGSGGQ